MKSYLRIVKVVEGGCRTWNKREPGEGQSRCPMLNKKHIFKLKVFLVGSGIKDEWSIRMGLKRRLKLEIIMTEAQEGVLVVHR